MKNSFFKVSLLLVLLLLFCCFDTASPQAMELTVATINIRIDSKKDSLNRWGQRKQLLFDYVSQQHLDVIGLQEVYPQAMKDIHKGLPEYAIVRRENKEKRADAPILFRKSAFKKIAQGTFWLSEFPDSVGFIGWDGRHPRFVNWAVLRSKATGKVFCVANTHLDNAGRQAREEGIKLLKERLASLAAQYPIILMGDMNSSEADSAVYHPALHNSFELHDTYYMAKQREGVDYSFHGFGKRTMAKRKRVDFIFVSDSIDVNTFNIPQENRQQGVYLSDHCPVISNITIK
ncbi:endonuclease/exonuclease/phosphatase family protein [Xylanibacter ruminicola]|uniref:Metal-dependent hydrolase, endonuclease/exonuclease/phosphatase family n=1 Tax=Xylanibacter ruminicola TaxID=839 RepID=A0A1M6R9U6_XYLRU|nr:endonuclease/exonuclease/phosphatase family protein [Xylanibacter ruminicola]SHK29077.1 Metal-dependent hydrolase, endonuclease/exonuclease/phosphatase family [Xylanibacter ruminicola]